MRDELKSILDEMLCGGIIEEGESSEWVSPTVLAHKADKSLRLCVDLRALNPGIVVDPHPLSNINKVVSMLEGATIFSTLDLWSAYHQIELAEDSKYLTAFFTPQGLFQFRRMPFCLASAASVFQRAMYHICKGMECFIKCFQDDILVFSKNRQEHLKHVKEVCEVLKKHGLTLKLSKCKFFCESVEYLGHTLSKEGVVPKKLLVDAIINAPAPDNKEKLLSFACLCKYYSKFIRDFATRMEPLRELTRRNMEFMWSEKQKQAFDLIKSEIVRAPTFKSFCVNKECIITVDATFYGVGSVLSQKCGSEEWNVAFVSRPLRETKRRYTVLKKELLAYVWEV